MLFHFFMHVLVDSCMCPDWGLNLQPRRSGATLCPARAGPVPFLYHSHLPSSGPGLKPPRPSLSSPKGLAAFQDDRDGVGGRGTRQGPEGQQEVGAHWKQSLHLAGTGWRPALCSPSCPGTRVPPRLCSCGGLSAASSGPLAPPGAPRSPHLSSEPAPPAWRGAAPPPPARTGSDPGQEAGAARVPHSPLALAPSRLQASSSRPKRSRPAVQGPQNPDDRCFLMQPHP